MPLQSRAASSSLVVVAGLEEDELVAGAEVGAGADPADSPPVPVMVSGYSRMTFARMIPTRRAEDLIAGHWVLLQAMGRVLAQLVWDNEGAVGSWSRS